MLLQVSTWLLKWQIGPIVNLRFTEDTDVFIFKQFGLFLEFVQILTTDRVTVKFFSTSFAQFKELFALVDAEEAAAKECGGNTGSAAAGKRIKNPGSRFC